MEGFMKFSEIATKYEINEDDFYDFLSDNNLPFKVSLTGFSVPNENVENYVYAFLCNDKSLTTQSIPNLTEKIKNRNLQFAKELAEERQLSELEAAAKKKAMASMLITSGFNFDGYKIVKYSGYISGDDAMTVSRGSSFTDGGVRDKLMASLVEIRRNALRELKEAAYDLGCNAVIGVDFDYITLDPQTANLSGGTTYQPYVFCVTANGNAVIIEKTED